MNNFILLVTIILILNLVPGCSPNDSKSDSQTDYNVLVNSINDFNWRLFEDDLAYRTTANIHNFGPSFYQYLAWIYMGTRHATYDQIKVTMGLQNFDDSTFLTNMHLLYDSLERSDQDVSCSMDMAIFYSDYNEIDSTYKRIMEDYFNFDIYEVDSLILIDDSIREDWTEISTAGEFTNADGGEPTEEIGIFDFIVTSRFNGQWSLAFDSVQNSLETFYHPFGDDGLVEMIHTTATLNYYEDSAVKFIDIPFGESGVYISFILPTNPVWPMPDFVLPSKENMAKWQKKADTTSLNISMPLINLYDYEDRIQSLRRLGITYIFPPLATLWYPYSNGRRVGIKSLRCDIKTKISNSQMMVVTAKENNYSINASIDFKLNRPFSYVIRDELTGVILSIGRVIEPL
ncbi:MAG: serpin family protein [Bacteroidota bacterium]